MSAALINSIRSTGTIPLGWVTAGGRGTFLNLGDALSPAIVSMVSGKEIRYRAEVSKTVRLAAVGTIGHMYRGGDVSFWGTGTSRYFDPMGPRTREYEYRPPQGTEITVYATRGPVSRAILAPDARDPAIYGDPLWLLPRFHEPPKVKKYELGVILHLSELQDLALGAGARRDSLRHQIPEGLAADVTLIDTVTPTGIEALRARLDLILSCKRIVSASLHGMVFAESYKIPCLYFRANTNEVGLASQDLDPRGPIDLRIVDLYRGLGSTKLTLWQQPRNQSTPWDDLITTIDKVFEPREFDCSPLIECFPGGALPLEKPLSGSVFDNPLIKNTPLFRPSKLQRFLQEAFSTFSPHR